VFAREKSGSCGNHLPRCLHRDVCPVATIDRFEQRYNDVHVLVVIRIISHAATACAGGFVAATCKTNASVLSGIPELVEQGLDAEAIAARLGCKVSTLKTRCSQARVSLRVSKEVEMVPQMPAAKPPKPPTQKRCFAFAMPTTLKLSRVAMSRLRQHAEAIGVNEAQLASDLLEAIAQDDLYAAVLDRAKDAA
jgi:hypothetical protein